MTTHVKAVAVLFLILGDLRPDGGPGRRDGLRLAARRADADCTPRSRRDARRGDYATADFLGEPFLDKPILFFWRRRGHGVVGATNPPCGLPPCSSACSA